MMPLDVPFAVNATSMPHSTVWEDIENVAAVHDLAASPHGNPLPYYRSRYAALGEDGERAGSS
ncbi:hypothetical protein [Streptomyces sp. NPDC054804]